MQKPDFVEMTVKVKGKDKMARVQRGSVIGKDLPFFGVLVGNRRSGKSSFIKQLMTGNIPKMQFGWDQYIYYSNSDVEGFNTTPYRDLTKPRGEKGKHSVVIFDDPPITDKHFKDMIGSLAREARHDGLSVLLTMHQIQDVGSARNEYIKANMDFCVLPSGYVARAADSIKRHGIYHPDRMSDLDKSPDNYNYNVIKMADRQLTIIKSKQNDSDDTGGTGAFSKSGRETYK